MTEPRSTADTPVEGLALVSAAWARYCTGLREDGSVVAPNDPHWDSLHPVAEAARSTPDLWLEQRQYYGDLADAQRFASAFSRWLEMIHSDGIEAAMDAYITA